MTEELSLKMGTYGLSKGCLYVKFDKTEINEYIKYIDAVSSIPEIAIKNKLTRDGENYHITVVTAEEMKKNDLNFDDMINKNCECHMFGFGYNYKIQTDKCYYLLCGSSELDNLRKKNKLPTKHFHVTLGFDFKDIHDVDKNIQTIKIKDKNINNNVLKTIKNNLNIKKCIEQLKYLYENNSSATNTYYEVVYNYAKLSASVEDFNTSLLLGKDLTNFEMANYVLKGHYIETKIKKHLNILKKEDIDNVSSYLTKNTFNESFELKQLIQMCNDYIMADRTDNAKTKNIYAFDKNTVLEIELPRNFSRVDNKVFGSAIIKEKHFPILRTLGIKQIINLIKEDKPTEEYVKNASIFGINVVYFPIADMQTTTLNIISNIVDKIFDDVTLVHCVGGVGRTNLILACYLIKTTNVSPSEAITILSGNRNVNVTVPQMMSIKEYYHMHISKYNTENANTDTTFKSVQLPGLIMLVGPPCSGKSTFSLEMQKYYGNQIVHINQDELGKKACEELFINKAKSSSTIILDRCNISKEERKSWLSCYPVSKKKICVWFNYDISVCVDRVKKRTNHPTIKNGVSGTKIIEEMYEKIENPILAEGFNEIIIVNDENSLIKLKNKFGFGYDNISKVDTIMKFPRTKHLINLGSMTRDDLLYDQKELKEFFKYNLIIEEKIDGANLGLFIGEDNKIMAQNRSHFVNSAYHEQFKCLDKWIESHAIELHNIFEQGMFILFGEWVYMKHSINYTKLPDYFLLYDIYDRNKNVFLSRNKIKELIKDSSLHMVPTIYEGMATLDDLKKMIETKSKFYDGQIEGIYVRACDNDIVKYRGKIVRSNFLCDPITGKPLEDGEHLIHWTKGKSVVNSLEF